MRDPSPPMFPHHPTWLVHLGHLLGVGGGYHIASLVFRDLSHWLFPELDDMGVPVQKTSIRLLT